MNLDSCDTRDLMSFPKGRNPIGCKWVFKNKFGVDGLLEQYKARLVAKGYFQREGVDFSETLPLVVEFY